VLAAKNRLRSSSDFSRTTKTGHRATSHNLVLYFLSPAQTPTSTNSSRNSNEGSEPKLGLIINKSIGGSVTRHQIARQLRHIARTKINSFPPHTLLVVRVLKKIENYETELIENLDKALARISELAAKK